MKYYIDFDNTIFDTVTFYNDLIQLLLDNGITQEYIDNFNNKHGINPVALVKSIKDNNIQKEYQKHFNNTKKYLYPDAIEFLRKKKDNQFILYTQGYLENQYRKIIHSGIIKDLDGIIVCKMPKTDVDIDYNNGIFIDDNTKVIKELLDKGAKKVYRMKRENNRHSKEILDDDRVIEIYSMNDIKD